ncbi:hypothetical protein L2E82_17431 [Cichorium intybus]|uniref:Uncharacterized protein n=1 Tax=Cichorium intybus TaxID=13427 RepID=A0ACB9F9H3_CICIN|nr:hypothetical protein L2E82_17431 [Cichorium intybus]
MKSAFENSVEGLFFSSPLHSIDTKMYMYRYDRVCTQALTLDFCFLLFTQSRKENDDDVGDDDIIVCLTS